MISLIVPHIPFPESDVLLKELLDSALGVDEKLIIVNDGIGYGKAVNIGFKLARGDYFIVANNDTKVLSGSLRLLQDKLGVTVPLIDPPPRDNYPRCFFCMPRWVYERVGGYDERFEVGYFEDDDLIRRLNNLNIPILVSQDVIISHLNGGGLTMKKMGEQKYFDENKERYNEKWSIPEKT